MAKESVFSTPRKEHLTADQMLENAIRIKNERQRNQMTMQEAYKLRNENPDFVTAMEATNADVEKQLAKDSAMEAAAYKLGSRNVVKVQLGLRSKMVQEGTEYLTGKFLGELIYESYWLDDAVKECTTEEIGENIENILGYIEESFQGSKVQPKQYSKLMESITQVITETAEKVADRICDDCEKKDEAFPEFELTDAEEEEMDDKLIDLGRDEIVDLIKSKVASVVQDEKEKGEARAEMFKTIDEMSKTEDKSSADTGSDSGETGAEEPQSEEVAESTKVNTGKYKYALETASYTAAERHMAKILESEAEVRLFDDPTWGEFKSYVSLQCKQIKDCLGKDKPCYDCVVKLIENLEKRLETVPENIPANTKMYVMSMVNMIYSAIPPTEIIISRFGNPLGAPDLQASSPMVDYSSISWMDLFVNIKTNLASVKDFCNRKNTFGVIDDETLNKSDCPDTGKNSLAQKIAQTQSRIIAQNMGGSLFEAMMLGAISTCEKAAMESSTEVSDENVENAALIESILNYTIFETLDTIGMYKFHMGDIKEMKKAFMNPMMEGIGIMSHGKDKKGLKKIRINTKKMKRKKLITGDSNKPGVLDGTK